MRQSNVDPRNEPMAANAPSLGASPALELVVAIRFRPGYEDEGFGVLIESGGQFFSGDDSVFSVRREQIALLTVRGILFDYVKVG